MSIYTWTGNPFVDAGIAAILIESGKGEPDAIDTQDVRKSAELISTVYRSEPWTKNMFSVFPNNPLTNPSVKDKSKRYKEYLNTIIEEIEPLDKAGNCISCGRRDAKTPVNKMHLPLAGYSGSHYFSFKAEGADVCSACNFAVQCAPLTFYACGKLALIHSNSIKIMKAWARECLKDVHKQIATRNFSGCYNEKYTNPVNALFHIVTNLIQSYEERWAAENATIRIYHFTNYNPGPDLDIYDLPAPVFKFLANARQSVGLQYWMKIVRKGYVGKTADKSDEEIRNYRNTVYQRLLNGQSILRYFIELKDRGVIGNWQFLNIYLREVLNMKEERVEVIKNVGDMIAEMIQHSANGKKRLAQLEMAKNYHSCRLVLLRLMQDRIAQKAETPLFSFEEYVEYLFPEGALGWNETRDLLLFRIYEKLHAWFISEGVMPQETEEESEMALTAEEL
jgi:CRISPR-associated protein Cst1